MKNLKYIIIFLMTPLYASADILIEREMYNSRNGENYNCKIHSDMKTELVNDGVSVGKFNTEFSASETDFKKWFKELKTQVTSAKFKLESKKIPQYTIRGFKRYSLYNGKSKISFYNLQHDVKKSSRGRKLSTVASGSIQTKVKDDNSNVQRLRGQTDEACKKALAKL